MYSCSAIDSHHADHTLDPCIILLSSIFYVTYQHNYSAHVNYQLLLQTSLEFAEDFSSRTDTPLNLVPDYAYFVYDAVWAIALVLNSTSEVNDTAAVRRALRDLTFTGVSVSSMH